MKSSILVILISLAGSIISAQTIKWHDPQSFSTLQNKDKKILIDFSAAWCGWCKVMDQKTFPDPNLSKVIQNQYFAVKIDWESTQVFDFKGKQYTAKQLGREYGVRGLPTLLVLDQNLDVLELIVGYQKPQQLITELTD